MKKLQSILLLAACLFVFAGCGSQNTGDTTSTAQPATAGSAQQSSEPSSGGSADTQSSAPESQTGKTLVVYYSATGSTKAVAEIIADATGADLFALEPEEPYSDADLDWTDDDSRVVYEYENESARTVALTSTTVDNWSDYDTVFVGYPIWWGIAAWPVNEFIENNDFTSKTVIPFCTSSSSGLGESGALLEEMAGTGNWQEGQRFPSGASEDDVRGWIEDLGL